ncbi:glycosyltransferase family 4 protein [Leifsonia sp. Leaf264]|uniref:glycosyltransferase family 4 protein n=1 Tax=Leifsonia sp. Leaf264 TaxID=1736314 RepID=UPI0006FD9693|nr:glycosyltransferase family 4 protein [Leifsonia sp. Leaf264]KQO99447.1 hypothetical protein ASF30_05775 [Leifsonia sp. Leaf264]
MKQRNRVVVFPAWGDNPYLNLLYLAPRAQGRGYTGITTWDSLQAAVPELGRGDVLHVHWTSPICQKAASVGEARRRLDEFTTLVQALQRRGGRLIWTIHNRLPHEVVYRDVEIALNRFLSQTADAVHVMAESTADVVGDLYPLRLDRMHVIPHPSYQGLYGRADSREPARRALGLAAGERTVLFFGQMRPYKGLSTLIDALRLMQERGDTLPTLLLAGAATADARREIEQTLPDGLRVIADFGFVADSEVRGWFDAADLAVFPYRSILNSGSVHLAATLGVPALLPGETHLRSQFADESWVRFYDAEDPVAGLARALAAPRAFERQEAGMAEFSERLSPWRVSRRFNALLESLEGSGATDAAGSATAKTAQLA